MVSIPLHLRTFVGHLSLQLPSSQRADTAEGRQFMRHDAVSGIRGSRKAHIPFREVYEKEGAVVWRGYVTLWKAKRRQSQI